MSSTEYGLWQIYFAMYPRGFRGDDLQFGHLRQTIASCHAKAGTDLSLSRFLLSPPPTTKRQKTKEEIQVEQDATFAYLDAKYGKGKHK